MSSNRKRRNHADRKKAWISDKGFRETLGIPSKQNGSNEVLSGDDRKDLTDRISKLENVVASLNQTTNAQAELLSKIYKELRTISKNTPDPAEDDSALQLVVNKQASVDLEDEDSSESEQEEKTTPAKKITTGKSSGVSKSNAKKLGRIISSRLIKRKQSNGTYKTVRVVKRAVSKKKHSPEPDEPEEPEESGTDEDKKKEEDSEESYDDNDDEEINDESDEDEEEDDVLVVTDQSSDDEDDVVD